MPPVTYLLGGYMSTKKPHMQAPPDDYIRNFVSWMKDSVVYTKGTVNPVEYYQVPVGAMNAIADNLLDIAATIEEKL